jgi:integrase
VTIQKSRSSPAGDRRRAKGSGGVTPMRPGVWRVDLELGRDPITGRRRRVARTVKGTRRDAETALAKLKLADHDGRLSKGTSARSVSDVFELYQDAVDSGVIELAPRTRVTTRSAATTMAAVVLPEGGTFGDVRLSVLSWQHIEHVYAAMRAGGLGVAWIRRCATVLSMSLELARKRGLIDRNPSKDATRPRTARTKPYSPSADEVRALLARACEIDPDHGDAVLVLVSTGMRKGELLALRWQDVNFDANELHVSAAITDGGRGVGVVRKDTKRSDWRDVPLTQGAVAALRRQWERRSSFLGMEPSPGQYVFPSDADGTMPTRPDTFSDHWVTARSDSKVTLQQLRHFAATTMLDAGESYRTVAELLGNSENTLRLHYDGRTDVGKRRAIVALEF